jgi:anti-anti-sigma factor
VITETKTRRLEPDLTVVEISGRLNLGNSLLSLETSLQRLIQEGARKLVIDLTGLSYIDSAGIGVLAACSGQMEQSGGKVRIAGAHGLVAKTLALVHLDRIAPLDADLETARRHLQA